MINISNPKDPRHVEDGTPLCPSRKPIETHGPELIVPYEAELMKKILASKANPADKSNYEYHPAADGNKGYRVWKPKERADGTDKK